MLQVVDMQLIASGMGIARIYKMLVVSQRYSCNGMVRMPYYTSYIQLGVTFMLLDLALSATIDRGSNSRLVLEMCFLEQ